MAVVHVSKQAFSQASAKLESSVAMLRQFTLVESNVLARRKLDTDLGESGSTPTSLKGAFDARQSGHQQATTTLTPSS